MKFIKYLSLLILIVLAGSTIYISISHRQFQFKKNANFKAPQAFVFQQINNLKNWESWVQSSVAAEKSQFTYTDKTTGENASLTWQSPQKNKTRLTNTVVIHNSEIKQQAKWKKGLTKINYTLHWSFYKRKDSTKVSLKIQGELNFWGKALQIFSDQPIKERLTPKVAQSLVHLKAEIIKKITAYSIHVDGIAKTTLTNYVYKSVSSKNNSKAIAGKRYKINRDLQCYISENYIQPSGHPFVLFNQIDKSHGNAIISIGIPISEENIIDNQDSDILLGTRWPRKVVKGTLKGSHKNLPELWKTTETYLEDLKLTKSRYAKPYEIFIKDSSNSKNPADWITELYIPLATAKEVNQNKSSRTKP